MYSIPPRTRPARQTPAGRVQQGGIQGRTLHHVGSLSPPLRCARTAHIYPDDLTPAIQETLAVLADLAFAQEAACERLAQWDGPEPVKAEIAADSRCALRGRPHALCAPARRAAPARPRRLPGRAAALRRSEPGRSDIARMGGRGRARRPSVRHAARFGERGHRRLDVRAGRQARLVAQALDRMRRGAACEGEMLRPGPFPGWPGAHRRRRRGRCRSAPLVSTTCSPGMASAGMCRASPASSYQCMPRSPIVTPPTRTPRLLR